MSPAGFARRAPVIASVTVLGALAGCAVLGDALASAAPLAFEPSREWLLAAHATAITVLVVAVIALSSGLVLGGVAALGPRVLDSLLSRSIEVAGAMPSVIVALVVSRALPGHGFLAISVTLALLRGLETAKIVRTELRTLVVTEFVLAARALGTGNLRLFRAHLLPHVLGSALASAALTAGAVTGLEAALSFLGLASFGPSWGGLVAQAVLRGAPSLAIAPALAVAVTLLSLHVIGSRIEERTGTGRRFV